MIAMVIRIMVIQCHVVVNADYDVVVFLIAEEDGAQYFHHW